MGKKQKNNKAVQKLLNLTMEKKFKKSFNTMIIGFIVVALIAVTNVLLLARAGGINIFTSVSQLVGLILMVISVVVNIILIQIVSKTLAQAVVDPITEIQSAVKLLQEGEFDIDLQYKSKDELGVLADELRTTCAELKAVVQDAGYVLGEMAEGRFDITSESESVMYAILQH